MITTSTASLSLYSATHSAANVTRVLKLEPTKSAERGEATRKFRLKEDGSYARRYYFKQSMWGFRVASDGVEGGSYTSLLRLADHLKEKAEALATLRENYTTVIWYFGQSDSGQAGFVWPAGVLAALAPLGCDIYGDVYLGEGHAEGPITEKAVLSVIPGREAEFEAAFAKAQLLLYSMQGCREVILSRGVEHPSQYLLLIRWDTVEDHEIGFRGSLEYQEWKKLLHHFYDPFPVVEHYAEVHRLFT